MAKTDPVCASKPDACHLPCGRGDTWPVFARAIQPVACDTPTPKRAAGKENLEPETNQRLTAQSIQQVLGVLWRSIERTRQASLHVEIVSLNATSTNSTKQARLNRHALQAVEDVHGRSVEACCDAEELLELVETRPDSVSELISLEAVGDWLFTGRGCRG